MRNKAFLSRLIVASTLAAATFTAGAADARADAAGERREALKTLLRSSNNTGPGERGIQVQLSKQTGVPEFLRRGNAPLARAEKSSHPARTKAVIEFFADQKALFRLRDPETELQVTKTLSDKTGRHHYVFQQKVDDVPIRGAEMRAHFDAENVLYAMTNDTVPSPSGIDTQPQLNSDDALRIAREQFLETALEQEAPQLELREVNGDYRLAYVVETFVNTVNRWQTVVDANSGEILRHHKDHHDGNVSGYGIDLDGKGRSFHAWERTGRYHLVDVTVPVHDGNEDPLVRTNSYGDSYVMDMLNTEGDSSETVASRSRDSGWDPAAVSALANGQKAYRYFLDTHQRQGIDGRNASLLFSIHYGEAYDNAFWNGKWMVFGDGGRRFSNLAGCLDIVGHEMSHGVIGSTARLEYENESGALNESIADVFGVLIEGSNWTLGEDCTKVTPGFLRDMSKPADGIRGQPSHMSEYKVLPNTEDGDWGGVHINSGIPNRAAYLLAEGLTKEDLGVSIGRARTGALYYRALTVYLAPQSTFLDLRRALLLAAADRFPDDDGVTSAIRDAFDAVGITAGSSGGTLDINAQDGGSTLNFGEVENGAMTSQQLVIENNTAYAVDLHEFRITGSGFSQDFSNTQLAPGEELSGTVTFAGVTAPGTHTAMLEIFTSAREEPQIVDLFVTVRKASATTNGADGKPSAGGGGAPDAFWLLMVLPAFLCRRMISNGR